MTPEQRNQFQSVWDKYVGRGEANLSGLSYALRQFFDAMIAQARADEREACAKVCDERAEWLHSNMHALKAEQSETLATAIRARKDSTT